VVGLRGGVPLLGLAVVRLPAADEAEVGGCGVDAEHEGGLGESHDAEGAAAEGFGGVALDVSEPAFDAGSAGEGGDPGAAAPVVALPRLGVDVAGQGDGALGAAARRVGGWVADLPCGPYWVACRSKTGSMPRE